MASDAPDTRASVAAIQPEALRDVQAATFAGVSRRTWWTLVAKGEAPRPVRIGHSCRWRLADLREWLEGLKPEGGR